MTEAAVAALRDDNGVRWPFADVTTADAGGLARVADLRYRSGVYAAYAVPASPWRLVVTRAGASFA